MMLAILFSLCHAGTMAGSINTVEYQLVQARAVACLIFFSLRRWAEPLVSLWATSTRAHFPAEGPATDAEGPVNSVGGIKEQM